jgi:sec-independent protein translocase protein TatA
LAVFGLSFWEIAIILVIALVVLGPKKLPELARSLGKGLKEFRRATEDFKTTIDQEMREEKKLEPPRAEMEAKLDAEKAAAAEAEIVAEVEKVQPVKSEG